jgi:hypothetical protein
MHPVILSNPYTPLSQIPMGTSWFIVQGLKDVFVCISIQRISQFLLAFE